MTNAPTEAARVAAVCMSMWHMESDEITDVSFEIEETLPDARVKRLIYVGDESEIPAPRPAPG